MQKFSTTKIEQIAIHTLENKIDTYSNIYPDFNKNDKELSWDGYIHIYNKNDTDLKKSNFIGKIPVQIKGHISSKEKEFTSKALSKQVNLDDLQNYYNNSGVLYFHIFVSNDGKKRSIFYRSIYPTIAKFYLDKSKRKKDKKSISVSFFMLENKYDSLYNVIFQFNMESKKQGCGISQIVQNAIKFEDLSQNAHISANVIGTESVYEFISKLEAGDVSLYARKDNCSIELPIEWNENNKFSLQQNVNSTISLSGKDYYNNYTLERNFNDEKIIHISENLVINLNKNKCTFNANSTLDLIVKDINFLKDLLLNPKIMISGQSIPFKINDEFGDLKCNIDFYLKLNDMLQFLKINIKERFESLSDETFYEFNNLLNINKYIIENSIVDPRIYKLNFENKIIPLLICNSDNKITILNAVGNFSEAAKLTITFDEGKTINKVPIICLLDPKTICNLYDYSYDSFYNQINNSDINNNTIAIINNIALNFISAYDISFNDKLLDIAIYCINKLQQAEKNKNDYCNFLNLIQIKKRRGLLCQSDIVKLLKLEHSDLIVMCCKYTLLENKNEAEKIYNKMTKETIKFFTSLPIYNLYKKLINK